VALVRGNEIMHGEALHVYATGGGTAGMAGAATPTVAFEG
jgi:hypothetical protein